MALLSIFIVAISCGPWAGALIGAVSLLIITGGTIPLDYRYDPPTTLYYSGYPEWLLFAAIGLIVGLLAQNGFFKTWWSSFAAGYLVSFADVLLFQILGRLFDISYVGAERIPGIMDILRYILAALLGIFANLHLGYLLIVIALVAFAVINLPFFSQKAFIQSLPQAGKTLSVALGNSEKGASLPLTEANKSSNKIVKGASIFVLIVVLTSILAYIGYLFIFALGVGAFGN